MCVAYGCGVGVAVWPWPPRGPGGTDAHRAETISLFVLSLFQCQACFMFFVNGSQDGRRRRTENIELALTATDRQSDDDDGHHHQVSPDPERTAFTTTTPFPVIRPH